MTPTTGWLQRPIPGRLHERSSLGRAYWFSPDPDSFLLIDRVATPEAFVEIHSIFLTCLSLGDLAFTLRNDGDEQGFLELLVQPP